MLVTFGISTKANEPQLEKAPESLAPFIVVSDNAMKDLSDVFIKAPSFIVITELGTLQLINDVQFLNASALRIVTPVNFSNSSNDTIEELYLDYKGKSRLQICTDGILSY